MYPSLRVLTVVVVITGPSILSVPLLPYSPTLPSQLSPNEALTSLPPPPPLNDDNDNNNNNINLNKYEGYSGHHHHNIPPPHLTQHQRMLKEHFHNVLDLQFIDLVLIAIVIFQAQ
jgi:hypothetical protein